MTIRELMHLDTPFSLPILRRNKFDRSIISLQDEMNRLFDDFMNDTNTNFRFWKGGNSFPVVDIIENEKDFKIRAEFPGMDPDDIEISVTEGFLTIRGERTEEMKEEDENYLRREASYGSFNRTLPLPQTADTEKADATFKNGIITINVPKKAEALQKPKKLIVKKAA